MTKENGRRQFIKKSALFGAALAASRGVVHAASGSDIIKVGLIGCGARGTSAFANMVAADNKVKLVAVADLFPEKAEGAVERIRAAFARNAQKYAGGKLVDEKTMESAINAGALKKFHGWDCADQLLRENVDVVIEATPPVFRTPHFEKIVAAGKHAFLEKPAAIDITQTRKMLELSKLADEKGLCVVCGTQRRYNRGYQEVIQRLQDGFIGDPIAAYCYWNASYYVGDSQLNHTEIPVDEMEYQVRNWYSFIWASGDHIVEQHVHNIDVIMWALGDNRFPLEVRGMGGRSTDLPFPKYGDRFSHFAVDFDMGDGLRLQSYCQQDPGAADFVGERIVCSKGIMHTSLHGKQYITDFKGNELFIGGKGKDNPECMEAEHFELLSHIRRGEKINRLPQLLNSNMLAIAGRMSAYSGKKFKYDWLLKRSNEDLVPKKFEWGKLPVGKVPVPGKHKLV